MKSCFRRLKISFATPAGAGFQNNHVIPFGLRDHYIIKLLIKEAGFDIDDDVRNRLKLPDKASSAAAANVALSFDSTHTGSHPAYQRFVQKILNEIGQNYGLTDVDGNKLPNASYDKEVIKSLAKDISNFQFYLKWNCIGGFDADGNTKAAAFVLNSKDPRFNGSYISRDEIYDRYYLTKGDFSTVSASEEFRKADKLQKLIDFNKIDTPDKMLSGLERGLKKLYAAKEVDIKFLDDVDISEIKLEKIVETMEKKPLKRIDDLKI